MNMSSGVEINEWQTDRNTNEVFGEVVANESILNRWFEKLWSGDFSLEDQPHGRPETKVDKDDLETSRNRYISNYERVSDFNCNR